MRLLFLLMVLVGSGCSTVSERVEQRFAPTQLPERVIERDEETVFAATTSVLEELGYRISRSGAAQGLLVAQSRRLPSEQFGLSEQYEIEIRLMSVQPGITKVTALVRQQTEGDFAAGATSTPLRAHGRYDVFFEELSRKLGLAQ